MNHLNTIIEQHAERALAEIKLMSAMARKQIYRIAEFPARSNAQKRRWAKAQKETSGFFPRCTCAHRRAGWDIDVDLLFKISHITYEMNPDFPVDVEHVELVLLALEQEGWKVNK